MFYTHGATARSLLRGGPRGAGPQAGNFRRSSPPEPPSVCGAALVAGLLYVTNFAWIAVNNVIAASVGAQNLRRARDDATMGGRPWPIHHG